MLAFVTSGPPADLIVGFGSAWYTPAPPVNPAPLQGYLSYKKSPPPSDPTLRLCLGS